MATTGTGVNVLRYSALIFGVFYGFQHQRSITASIKASEEHAEYERKQSLIDQAKQEWAKKTLPPPSKTASGDVISDPDDKNFDLEAYLIKVAAES
ncbi:hypothetical protein DV736_g1769, partial [Chaetothyriales sp. CBS 134916]